MKKLIMCLSILLLFPINLLAYSNYIIPGGENIGITINTDGLMVVGFYKVNGEYIANDYLKVGDIITEIEGRKPESISDMSQIIDETKENNEVNIKILRNNKEMETKLKLVLDSDVYKTGLYIKDKITGIGTLTYIDPVTKIYGALGHEIVLSEVTSNVEIRSGNIYDSYVKSVDRSVDGTVGSKNATILYDKILGTIEKNTKFGIYGKFENITLSKDVLEVSSFDEIELGKAKILTVFDGSDVTEYEIEIVSKNEKEINTSKSINFKITDEALLEESGGVVQGMSGSPIIQNGKIIGAVTHVIVDDVKRGYGIYIKTMLEEGEK